MDTKMIRVTFRTNLDDYKGVQWPEHVYPCIKEGDWVRSKDGRCLLEVVQITHTYQHGMEIELHKVGSGRRK